MGPRILAELVDGNEDKSLTDDDDVVAVAAVEVDVEAVAPIPDVKAEEPPPITPKGFENAEVVEGVNGVGVAMGNSSLGAEPQVSSPPVSIRKGVCRGGATDGSDEDVEGSDDDALEAVDWVEMRALAGLGEFGTAAGADVVAGPTALLEVATADSTTVTTAAEDRGPETGSGLAELVLGPPAAVVARLGVEARVC